MSRLTERERADKLYKLILGGQIKDNKEDWRYIRLCEYEDTDLEPEAIISNKHELEVYKRALGLTVNHICEVAEEDYNESHCPLRKFEKDYEDYRLECKCSGFQRLDDYYLDKARKELEDERK